MSNPIFIRTKTNFVNKETGKELFTIKDFTNYLNYQGPVFLRDAVGNTQDCINQEET